MGGWERFADSFLNARVAAEYLPKIVEGFWLTVQLALAIVVAGLAAGLLLAILRSLGVRPLNWLIVFAVDLFRALPPLVIIALLFFGLPPAGVQVSGFASAWLALSLVLMAFSDPKTNLALLGLGAFLVDVVVSALVAGIFTAPELPRNRSLLVFAVLYFGCTAIVQQTPGMRLLKLRVVRVDRSAPIGLWRAVVRTALLMVLVPALVVDGDGRGLHDRLTGTAVIRRV